MVERLAKEIAPLVMPPVSRRFLLAGAALTTASLLIPIAVGLAAVLFAETAFIIFFVQASPSTPTRNLSDVGLTSSIGAGLFTGYLLPFEITSILLLMAIVGAITLARRGGLLPPNVVVVPGYQVLARDVLDPLAPSEAPPIVAHTTEEVERQLGLEGVPHVGE